jgi:hypothetical protein
MVGIPSRPGCAHYRQSVPIAGPRFRPLVSDSSQNRIAIVAASREATHVFAALLLAFAAASSPTFSARVTNPYYPLLPGMRWVYRGEADGRKLRNVVVVSSRTEQVDGKPCAVVIDRVYLDGKLRESTIDWYSQDDRGVVWYFGEATKELDRHGHVTSREGSWRAGVDGARAGIFMPAKPRVGQSFVQEHYPSHAEDHFKVVDLHASISTPYRRFRGSALQTREWTPLEPGVRDGKWYVRGIGQVAEITLKGGNERARLVSFSDGAD